MTDMPPSTPLLTIIVPTYNRADKLALLLRTLRSELSDLEADVVVLVSDNASPDHTQDVTRAMQAEWPALVVRRQPTNVGADENFCSCVDSVTTRHFWFIGDDDLPKRGVCAQVVDLLRKQAPSLVYMQSEWLNAVTGPDQGEPVGTLRVRELDIAAFAQRVHIWFTFLSGVVIDRMRLLQAMGRQPVRRFTGTNLVQLGWILPLLRADGRFLFVEDRCILATKNNSGGYGLLTVFGVNFVRVVNESLGARSPIARALVGASVLHYLPGLTWGGRQDSSKRHQTENAWPAMQRELGHLPLFWLLLVPLGRFPHWLAQPFYQAWRVFHRLHREVRQLRNRALAGTAR